MKKAPLFIFFLATAFMFTVFSSCKPGEGGKGAITGQALFNDTSLSIVGDTARNAQIFISYGEDTSVSADQELKTDDDGFFEFKPLKKGDYYISVVFDHPIIPKRYIGGMKVILGKDETKEIEIECE